MKRVIKPLIVLSFLLLCVAGIFFYLIQPPKEWDEIKIGMTEKEVKEIIPEFDNPMGGIKADFEYEKRMGLTWVLAVGRSPNGVDFIEKELWTSWPDRRRLWRTTTTKAEQGSGGNG